MSSQSTRLKSSVERLNLGIVCLAGEGSHGLEKCLLGKELDVALYME